MGGNKGERPSNTINHLRKHLPAKAFERSSDVACGAATGGALRVQQADWRGFLGRTHHARAVACRASSGGGDLRPDLREVARRAKPKRKPAALDRRLVPGLAPIKQLSSTGGLETPCRLESTPSEPARHGDSRGRGSRWAPSPRDSVTSTSDFRYVVAHRVG